MKAKVLFLSLLFVSSITALLLGLTIWRDRSTVRLYTFEGRHSQVREVSGGITDIHDIPGPIRRYRTREIVEQAKEEVPSPSPVATVPISQNRTVGNDPVNVGVLGLSRRELDQVLEEVERCMTAANLKGLVPRAKESAERYVKDFRKVIPQYFLSGYSSHCWRQSRRALPPQIQKFMSHFDTSQNNGDTREELLCLPKLLTAGVQKCGSTFMWCFAKNLLSESLGVSPSIQPLKELFFWRQSKYIGALSEYIYRYKKNYKDYDHEIQKRAVLIDGSPDLISGWIGSEFHFKDFSLLDYCLLPATLPHFLPNVKLTVVMREPSAALYSLFWFSCTAGKGHRVSPELQIRGPQIFHERITKKISMFLDCMRDKKDPVISRACSLEDSSYDSCILHRLHLAAACTSKIDFNRFSPEMPKCGSARPDHFLYYVHIHRWLSVVPKERFLFLTLEETIVDPLKTAKGILNLVDTPLRPDVNVSSIASYCREHRVEQRKVHYKTNPELKMRSDTRTLIKKFYKPFNAKLSEILNEPKFLWQ